MFNAAAGCQDVCHVVDNFLMLPAPEDIYQKEESVEPEEEFIIPFEMLLLDFPQEFFENMTVPSILETPKPSVVPEFSEIEEEEDYSDEIRAMKIAGFVGQCIVFLFFFTVITLDVDQFDEDENGEIVIHKLHRAREIQTCPLPSRQNVRIYRRLVESDC
uniref:Cse1 domain-containing protein n=1 Tax=Caenorhabditis tropicalis TaxID=1561998 RepID=A0A1I7TNR0_9PELO